MARLVIPAGKLAVSIVFISLLFVTKPSAAQQASPVTDTTPVVINGLQMGFSILSLKEKEVGDKGNFSRYSIRVYVTNVTPEAKIFMYKQGFNLLSDLSPEIVRFYCLNATGARFTSKEASLQAEPCNVLADVEDKDPATNKIVHNKRFVQIGYWIKAGETFHTDVIFIVPLNEYPKISALPVLGATPLVGNAFVPDRRNDQGFPPAANNDQPGFVKLKNVWQGTYLNTEKEDVLCSQIDDGWWSAQWQLLPVSGTDYVVIQNRWKQICISTERPGAMYSANTKSVASLWKVEHLPGTDAVRFRNVGNGAYLNIEKGFLQSTPIWDDALSARWLLERP